LRARKPDEPVGVELIIVRGWNLGVEEAVRRNFQGFGA
jgi:hypothetical protein